MTQTRYVVNGSPRRPTGSRWVVLQVRRGSTCSGLVGSPSTLNRVLEQLVRTLAVQGRIRSSELRVVN